MRRVRDADLGQVGARGGIGHGRHDTYLARQRLLRVGPQAHHHILDAAQGVNLVFGNADHDFLLAAPGHLHHGRTGRHHLPHFGLDARDDAIDVGQQAGIAGLVGLATVQGLRRFHVRLRRLVGGIFSIEHGLTDEIFLAQILVALQFGARQVAARFRADQRRLGLRLRQLQVDGIELHQHLPLFHAGAHLDLARDDLAAHAETQLRHHAGHDLARQLGTHINITARQHDRAHGAHVFHFDGGLGTGRQGQRQGGGGNQPQGGQRGCTGLAAQGFQGKQGIFLYYAGCNIFMRRNFLLAEWDKPNFFARDILKFVTISA